MQLRILRTLRRYQNAVKKITNSTLLSRSIQLMISISVWSWMFGEMGYNITKYDWITPILMTVKDALLDHSFVHFYEPQPLDPLCAIAATAVGILSYLVFLRLSNFVLYFAGISSSPRIIGFAFQPFNFIIASVLSVLAITVSGFLSTHLFFEAYLFGSGSSFPAPHVFESEKFDRFLLCCTLFGFRIFRGLSAGWSQFTFRCIAPSEIIHEGSFAHEDGNLPATKDNYVNEGERILIYKFGHKFGCHHCGLVTHSHDVKYHGDHIPVTKHVRHGLRRFIAGNQQFFPQCHFCSNQQGATVGKDRRFLCMHRWSSLRLWHFWPPVPLVYYFLVQFLESRTQHVGVLQAFASRFFARVG